MSLDKLGPRAKTDNGHIELPVEDETVSALLKNILDELKRANIALAILTDTLQENP